MENREKFELGDDMLDNVSGGVLCDGIEWNAGNKVAVSSCSCCGKSSTTGTITSVGSPKRGGSIRVEVSMDCCGSTGRYTIGNGIRKI